MWNRCWIAFASVIWNIKALCEWNKKKEFAIQHCAVHFRYCARACVQQHNIIVFDGNGNFYISDRKLNETRLLLYLVLAVPFCMKCKRDAPMSWCQANKWNLTCLCVCVSSRRITCSFTCSKEFKWTSKRPSSTAWNSTKESRNVLFTVSTKSFRFPLKSNYGKYE